MKFEKMCDFTIGGMYKISFLEDGLSLECVSKNYDDHTVQFKVVKSKWSEQYIGKVYNLSKKSFKYVEEQEESHEQ